MASNTIVVNVLGNVRGLQKSLAQAGKDLNGLENIGTQLGGSLKLTTLAFAGMAGAAVGGAAAGAAALAGLTAGVLGLGIAVAAQNAEVKSAFAGMADGVMEQMRKITAPFVPVLVAGAGTVGKAFDTIAPSLERIFKAGAPLLDELFGKLVPLAATLGPVLEQAFAAGIPVIRAFADGLVPVVKGLGGMFKHLENPAFAQFISALMEGIGALLPTIGQLLAALAPLGVTLMPLIVSAFQGLVDMLIKYVIPAFTTAFNFIDQHRELFGNIALAIGVGILAFKAVGLVMAVLAAGPAVLIIAALAALALVFKDDLIPLVSKAVDWFKEMYQKHAPTVAKAFADIRDAVKDMYERIKPLIAQLRETFSAAFDFIKAAVSTFIDVFMRVWNKYGDDILSAIKTAWSGITKFLEGVFQIIEGLFKVFTGILTGDWRKAWDGIKEIVSGAWKAITGIITAAWGAIKLTFTAGMAAIDAVVHTVFNAMKAFIGSILGAIGGVITGAWNGIKSGTSAAWNAVSGAVSAAWNSIKSAVTTGITNVVNAVKGMPGKIKAGLGNLGSLLYEAGKDIIEGLLNGIKAMAGKAAEVARGVANSVKNAVTGALGINSPSTVFREIGVNINEGLVIGLERTRGVQRAASGLSDAVAKGFEAPTLTMARTPIAAGASAFAPTGATINLTVNAPVGSSPHDIGRELDQYLAAYTNFGGRRLS